MRKIFSFIFIAAMTALTAGNACAQNAITVSETEQSGSFPIVGDDGTTATIVFDKNDAQVVETAATALAGDIKAVTGKEIKVGTELTAGSSPIIAGTIGSSELIDRLAAEGKIDVSDVNGKWEAYGLQTVDNPTEGVDRALVLFGSTPRGTAYAIFEVSRLMGVSPYIWWADVVPAHKDRLYASAGRSVTGEPSVKYRGIFINDEDWGFQPWAAKNMDPDRNNVGPNSYAKVMELLLRLRANTLWPAMHLCSEAFWANKANLPVAKKYGIVLGSSHCEQMLRDNEWEWRRWGDGTGTYENWNYVTNKEKIQQYWEERVIESKGFDAMYTTGMRGVHDWGISGYPTTQDKVRGLTEIIDFQRQLLKKHIGDPTTVPQIFIPYKEVLEAYNAGLQVPEDITLTWVDDNHGYIRQMPTKSEQARSGGNGIYYHLSYWGTPQDYLWLCSTSPSLISYELSKGYDYGIRTLWIINVGDIKPAEAELEFCMDLAWDVERWNPEEAHKYSRYWAAKTFGEEYADELSDIKQEYYRLGAGGKPEHIFAVNYTDEEKDRRIVDYKNIVDKVDNLKARIPSELQDAYFEMIEYPVKGAYYMNVKTFRAAQSLTLAKAGQRDKALEYAAEARKAYRQIEQITNKYNNEIAGGKWNEMMDSKPRQQSQFYMPETATLSNISSVQKEIEKEQTFAVAADKYTSTKGNIVTLEGLGVGGNSVTVWPIDETVYSADKAGSAPYAEYDVEVKSGANMISARCLPTFPINSSFDLRVAISVDGGEPQVCSLKTTATEGKWNTTVLQGFNDATVTYNADEDKTVSVRVYMLDPGVVLSEIYNRLPESADNSLTVKLIKNNDFELRTDGTPNPQGNTDRGIPYGWDHTGELTLGQNGLPSYGINQDAANLHGSNVCWINSFPMPEFFELSQTIPASEIEPGTYRVSCMMWMEENKKTSGRLFANNNVQYYGSESDYTRLLTPGEVNTYAGHAGQNGAGPFNLMPMEVYVTVAEGEDLKLGIRSGNKRNDGTTATDNAGWFKVDNFRIEKVSGMPEPQEEDLTLTKQLITNYDFELYDDNGTIKENTSGDTRRGTIYGIHGWKVAGRFPGDSYGINKDASNPHATNVCWFQAKNGNMPDDFALYQTIPADKLTPGRYMICCRLWAEEGFLSTVRLFANDNVQYYGMDIDYDKNLTPGEHNTFAGYIGGAPNTFVLQDMYVYVDIEEGDDLKFGIRSSNTNADGTKGTDVKNGWFKTDFFRIHKVDDTNGIGTPTAGTGRTARGVYNIKGQKVGAELSDNHNLPSGIYVVDGRKTVVR